MSSLSDTTSDIKIDSTHLWTLSLFVDDRRISFMLHNDLVADSLICRDIMLGQWNTPDEYLKAVENAVYDNQLLLNDFKRVNISVDTRHFMFVPPQYGTEDDVRRAFDVAFPDAEGDFVLSPSRNCRVDVAYKLPQGVYHFLRRTFNNAPIRLHHEVLCSFFRGKTNASNINKLALFLRGDGRLDVCAFKQGELQMSNTFVYRSNDDALFFILAVWNTLGFDAQSDEIQIAGDKDVRAAIMPRLRDYVTYVVPIMMPPEAIKLASDAARAPFNLVILAI